MFLSSASDRAALLALDSDDHFCFTLQPRFAARKVMLEIVKGGADPGESPLLTAQARIARRTWFFGSAL